MTNYEFLTPQIDQNQTAQDEKNILFREEMSQDEGNAIDKIISQGRFFSPSNILHMKLDPKLFLIELLSTPKRISNFESMYHKILFFFSAKNSLELGFLINDSSTDEYFEVLFGTTILEIKTIKPLHIHHILLKFSAVSEMST